MIRVRPIFSGSAVGTDVESLDLAMIDANSIYPMSEKTGHTSYTSLLFVPTNA